MLSFTVLLPHIFRLVDKLTACEPTNEDIPTCPCSLIATCGPDVCTSCVHMHDGDMDGEDMHDDYIPPYFQ